MLGVLRCTHSEAGFVLACAKSIEVHIAGRVTRLRRLRPNSNEKAQRYILWEAWRDVKHKRLSMANLEAEIVLPRAYAVNFHSHVNLAMPPEK